MKTSKTFKQNLLKSLLLILISASTTIAHAGISFHGITPAKPASFTAEMKNNNRVDLTWSTDTENNLSHFIVERSQDGIHFSNAALVFAYGNTITKSDYAFADNISKIKSAAVFYRVTSLGTDGKNQHSDIIVIHLDNINR